MSVSKVDVINLLLKHPNGLKARQIASYFSTDRKEINQILYSNSNDFVVNDLYIWKIKNQTQNKFIIEKNVRELTLKELRDVYKLGYIERSELEKLDFLTFQRAVEHAKIISKNKKLPFMTSQKWLETVVLGSDEFAKAIEDLEQVQRDRKEAQRVNRELRNEEINKISIFCDKYNISENTKAKLVLTGKSYSDILVIWNICYKNGISEYAFLSLVQDNISYSEIESRISKITYYKNNYPDLNISLSSHILSTEKEFSKYANASLQKSIVRCLGDCSNCKRDKCIMEN